MLESTKKSKKQTWLHTDTIAASVSTAKRYIYNYMFKKDSIRELRAHHVKTQPKAIIMCLSKEISSSPYHVYRKKCYVLTSGRKVSFHRQ